MKVVIGPYRNSWVSTQSVWRRWIEWNHKGKSYYSVEEEDYTKWDRRIEKVLDCFYDWVLYPLNKVFFSKLKRKIKIRIDYYDTWGMDNTLAHIILPMLKQLKATKHGSPYVDQEDLPVELRLTKREQKVFNEGHWNKKLKATEEEINAANKKFHSQFDWVLDQMIWSFEQELDEENEHKNYYDPYLPDEVIEDDPDDTIIHMDGTTSKSKSIFSKEWKREMGKYNPEKHKAYAARKQLGFTLFGKYFSSLWD